MYKFKKVLKNSLDQTAKYIVEGVVNDWTGIED